MNTYIKSSPRRTHALHRGLRGALPAMLLAASVAWGQEAPATTADLPSELSQLTLEELADLKIDSVYGASAYAQKVSEAPSSVSIITADQIQRYGYRTLADILRSVRGFYVTHDRNYSFLGVRGFSRPGDYNSRVLLLVDGHRLNDNIFDSALIGTEFPLDVELIQRVEIIRGPSSSLYGTSAFFAVINVITKGGHHLKGMDVSATAGSLETRRGRVSYGQAFSNGAEVLLSVSAYRSEGQRRLFFEEFAAPATNFGIAEDADSDDAQQALAKLAFGDFTVQGLYGSRDKRVPTASFGTVFNDPRSGTIETHGYLDLLYERAVRGGWNVAARLNYDRYTYDGDYVFEHEVDGVAQTILNRDFARGSWWGADVKVTKRLPGHIIAIGSEYRDNVRQDQYNYDEGTRVEHLDDRRSSKNSALFLQDEITLHPKVLVNIGMRYDHYQTFGGTTNPRAGLIYSPTTKTTLKLLYGQAFRAPNVYELFWQQGDLAKTNPQLQPETNRTSELVLEQSLGSRVRVAATGFYYRINGLITQQTDAVDNLLVYNNVEAIIGRGIELEVERKTASGLESRVSYTLQDSYNVHTLAELTNSPAHLAQANLITPLGIADIFAGVEMRYLSTRRTVAGNRVGSGFIANATILDQKLAKGVQLSATLFNVFDSRYADPGSEEHRQDSIVQNGRTFRVRLSYRFPSVH